MQWVWHPSRECVLFRTCGLCVSGFEWYSLFQQVNKLKKLKIHRNIIKMINKIKAIVSIAASCDQDDLSQYLKKKPIDSFNDYLQERKDANSKRDNSHSGNAQDNKKVKTS